MSCEAARAWQPARNQPCSPNSGRGAPAHGQACAWLRGSTRCPQSQPAREAFDWRCQAELLGEKTVSVLSLVLGAGGSRLSGPYGKLPAATFPGGLLPLSQLRLSSA